MTRQILVLALTCLAATAAEPNILFVDTDAGPTTGGPDDLGIPIAIFGTGFGPQRGGSIVTIGGVEVAAYRVWGERNAENPLLDMIVVQPGPGVTGGTIVVKTANGESSGESAFTVAPGRFRYVAPTGSPTGACTEGDPCNSISRAIEPSISQPGDTILVRGGELAESEIWIRREYGHGGTAGARKIIRNYPGEDVYLTNGARPFIVDADYVTISGFRFRNGKTIGIPDTGDAGRRRGVRFINNSLTGPISWGFIDTHGDEHILAGNSCEATSSPVGTQGHCYYVSYGNDLQIIYNVGSGAPGYGLHVFDQQRSANDFRREIRHVLIEGNLLKNSRLRSGLIIAMNDEGGRGNLIEDVVVRNNIFTANSHIGMVVIGEVRNVRVYHNTFFENGRQGINIAESARQVDIRANLFVQSENTNCLNDCSWYRRAHVEARPSANLRANGYFPGEPAALGGVSDSASVSGGSVGFVDSSAFNFNLEPGSEAIDRAESIEEVKRDWRGRRRPLGAAPDLGAFEASKEP